MASGVANVVTALIGAAGQAAPTVAAAIKQRQQERAEKKAERRATSQPALPAAGGADRPWPTWVKVTASVVGVAVAGTVAVAAYRALFGGGSRRRNPEGKRRKRRRR